MKLPKFFSRVTGGAKTVAVCDIGSGSVAVAIVEVDSDGVRIATSERRALKLEEKKGGQSVDQLKTLAQETATAVLDMHMKGGGISPTEVVGAIHAPWVRSETIYKKQRFENTTVITDAHIRKLAKEAAQEKTEFAPDRIFERSVLRVSLNGYPTEKPEGKKADRIDIAVLHSEADAALLRSMKEALGAVFVGRKLTYYSASFEFTVVIRKYMPTIEHYTLVDVTSTATSATVVRHGSIQEHAEAAIGWRSIISGLASIQGTTHTEALSRVRMVSDDICGDAVCQSVSQALSKIEPSFVQEYGTMFGGLAKIKKPPGTLILITPPDLVGWFAGIFSRIDFAQFSMSERPFSIQQLHSGHFTDEITQGGKKRQDTGIYALAAFIHIQMQDRS